MYAYVLLKQKKKFRVQLLQVGSVSRSFPLSQLQGVASIFAKHEKALDLLVPSHRRANNNLQCASVAEVGHTAVICSYAVAPCAYPGLFGCCPPRLVEPHGTLRSQFCHG